MSHHQILPFIYSFVEMISNSDFYIFRVSFCKDGGKQNCKDVELQYSRVLFHKWAEYG